MKKGLLALFLIISVAFIGCEQKSDKPEGQTKTIEFNQIQSKVIETFGDDASKETIEFTYANENDFFWQKAVHKDGDGNVIKTRERELDEQGLPLKEKIHELETVTSVIEYKYCPETWKLVEKTIFEGDEENMKKVHFYKNIYDGVAIVAKEVEHYSTDPEFKNVDGNNVTKKYKLRYVPSAENRYGGDLATIPVVESAKYYETGKGKNQSHGKGENKEKEEEIEVGAVYLEINTEFNDKGYPVHMTTTQPDCEDHASEEWYKLETDGFEDVVAIVGYANAEKTEQNQSNMKIIFEYDQDRKISSIEEFKYNTETKAFDKFHSAREFEFVNTDDEHACYGCCSKIDASVTKENYCWHRKLYSRSEREIITAEDSLKVIEYRKGSYEGDFQGRKADMELTKKKTKKYRKASKTCSGECAKTHDEEKE